MNTIGIVGGLIMLTLTGCMSITTSVAPENPQVAETLIAEDCVPVFFGLANGQASVEGAIANAAIPVKAKTEHWAPKTKSAPQTITKIRRVQLYDLHILFIGQRCVEVVGE